MENDNSYPGLRVLLQKQTATSIRRSAHDLVQSCPLQYPGSAPNQKIYYVAGCMRDLCDELFNRYQVQTVRKCTCILNFGHPRFIAHARHEANAKINCT
jgi:hypothetical protein